MEAKSDCVTIIGAGMAGLTLAAVLHRSGVRSVVYDADLSATSRHQGGMLDMHEDSGQSALSAAGLLEAFHDLTFEGGDATRLLDRSAKVLFASEGNGTRPEVERGALRRLLLESLPAGTVKWNSKLVSLRRTSGGFDLTFANGSVVRTEVLVGADGAWSNVRPLVTPIVPVFTGFGFVELRFSDVDMRHPKTAALVGMGSLFALAPNQGFLGHREPNNEVSVYAAFQVPETRCRGTVSIPELMKLFAEWHQDFLEMFERSDSEPLLRAIYALPIGLRWQRAPGVALIGDAAHLMSPFAGEGVNLAMIDGADLAAAMLKHPQDIESAFAEYEQTMFPRAEAKAIESAQNLGMAFDAESPKGFLDFFSRMQDWAKQPPAS